MEPNSIDVARAVMALADVHGLRLNLTQLQKLLYIVYGTCLVTLDHPPSGTSHRGHGLLDPCSRHRDGRFSTPWTIGTFLKSLNPSRKTSEASLRKSSRTSVPGLPVRLSIGCARPGLHGT